jgi:5-methylcytosine-specific restriction endonuclease McrA
MEGVKHKMEIEKRIYDYDSTDNFDSEIEYEDLEDSSRGCKVCKNGVNKSFQNQILNISKSCMYGGKAYPAAFNMTLKYIENQSKPFTVFDVIRKIKHFTDGNKQLKILKYLVCKGYLSCQYKLGNPIFLPKSDIVPCEHLRTEKTTKERDCFICSNQLWFDYDPPENYESNSENKNESAPRDVNYTQYLKSNQWQEVRKYIIERDGGLCQNSNCNNPGEQVHHKTYDHWSGVDYLGATKEQMLNMIKIQDLRNKDKLILLCADCHRKIHKR